MKKPTQKTLLAVGEGDAELVFLRFLRSLYAQTAGLSVIPRNAHGGDPNAAVDCAIKQTSFTESDWVLVFMDTDKPWKFKTETLQQIKSRPIHIIGTIPCFEGFLLNLVFKNSIKLKASESPKSRFKKVFKKAAEYFDIEDYQKLLNLEKLAEARRQNPILDALIKVFEGKASNKKPIYLGP